MGRKIPGRKHRGVRDPQKQQLQRFSSIKDKINAPPRSTEEQPIPKSLERVMMLKDKVKSGEIPLKRKRKHKREKPVSSHPHPTNLNKNNKGKPLKPTPYFEQMAGESNKHFLNRVHRITDSFIKETQFEDKYGVDVRRDESTGEVVDVVKRPKDELDSLIKQAKKDQKNPKKKKKKANAEPKLSNSEKRKLKVQERKENKQVKAMEDFKTFKDNVAFGEVVHAPPTLSAPRRVESLKCAPRPGQKDLLLKQVMSQNGQRKSPQVVQQRKSEKKIIHKAIDKKGKRKELPVAMRRQLDKQQKEVIEAYKLLKKQKIKT